MVSLRARALGSVSVIALTVCVSIPAQPAAAACVDQANDDVVCSGTTAPGTDKPLPAGSALFNQAGAATTFTGAGINSGADNQAVVNLGDGIPKPDIYSGEPTYADLLSNAQAGATGNGGTINSAISLGGDTDHLVNFGAITGAVDMGSGNDEVFLGKGSTLNGGLSMGDGNDFVYAAGTVDTVDLGNGSENWLVVGGAASGLTDALAQDIPNIGQMNDDAPTMAPVLLGLTATPTATGHVTGGVTGGNDRDEVYNLGTIDGGVNLGAGDGFVYNAGALNGTVDLSQAGTSNDIAAEVLNFGTITGDVRMAGGESIFFNLAAVPDLLAGITADNVPMDQDPLVDVMLLSEPAGTLSGTVNGSIISGTGQFEVFNLGTVTGVVDGRVGTKGMLVVNRGLIDASGAGNVAVLGQSNAVATQWHTPEDEVVNVGTITGDVQLGDQDNIFVNGQRTATFRDAYVAVVGSDGSGGDDTAIRAMFNTAQDLSKGGVLTGSYTGGTGEDTVANFGRITGTVTTGAGNDLVANAGEIGGAVDLGAGDDEYVHGYGSSVPGVDGNTGRDTLTVAGPGGTVDLSLFSNFEVYNVGAGWQTAQVDFSGTNDARTVDLSSTVTGAVTMGGGDDTVGLKDGASIGGPIDGGHGTNTLNLQGGGEINTEIKNFATLKLEDPAPQPSKRWKLNGKVTVDKAEINAGGLAVNGTMTTTGGVTVGGNGILGGSGTIVGDITDRGRLAPGNSIGTITNTGNYTKSGVYEVEIDPNGTSDKLSVTGTLTIDPAATVFVTAETPTGATTKKTWTAADFQDTTTYTIAQAGAVTGTFASVTDDFLFLNPALSYNGTTVTLTMEKIADIREVVPGIASDRANAVNELLQSGVAPGFLEARSGDEKTWNGESAAVAVSASGQATGQFTGAMGAASASGRAAGAGAGVNTGDVMAAEDGGIFRSGSLWLAGLGSWGEVDGDASAAGYGSRTWGLSAGADTPVTDDLLVGVALGYAGTNVDSDLAGTETDVDSYQLGIYGTWTQGPWYANGTVFYGRHAYDSERLVVSGGNAQTASADYNANEYGAGVEVGRTFAASGLEVQPYAGLDVSLLDRESFTESGLTGALAGADLAFDSETYTTGRASAGLRVAYPYTSQGGWRVVPTAEVGVAHRFGDTDGSATARFTGGTTDFTVSGPDVNNTVGVLGLGLSTNSDSMGLFVDYGGEFNAEQTQHTVNGGIVFRW
ncbi:autotransporter outer membrane beta-barrel domain-containing protein [Caenispirillum salinarum]|uniref:autotransporter outer membrane beta-barrel domain-containing protein n=1 Tax=Caenispirillum salinarum TaxID=859058 RepID=UPI0005BE5929|nr:autotransporter outer membrane beta-barrel domain-containing protein [Caenispirillum salinarum]